MKSGLNFLSAVSRSCVTNASCLLQCITVSTVVASSRYTLHSRDGTTTMTHNSNSTSVLAFTRGLLCKENYKKHVLNGERYCIPNKIMSIGPVLSRTWLFDSRTESFISLTDQSAKSLVNELVCQREVQLPHWAITQVTTRQTNTKALALHKLHTALTQPIRK